MSNQKGCKCVDSRVLFDQLQTPSLFDRIFHCDSKSVEEESVWHSTMCFLHTRSKTSSAKFSFVRNDRNQCKYNRGICLNETAISVSRGSTETWLSDHHGWTILTCGRLPASLEPDFQMHGQRFRRRAYPLFTRFNKTQNSRQANTTDCILQRLPEWSNAKSGECLSMTSSSYITLICQSVVIEAMKLDLHF